MKAVVNIGAQRWPTGLQVRNYAGLRPLWQRAALQVGKRLTKAQAWRVACDDVARAVRVSGAVQRPLALASSLYVYRDALPQLADQLQPQHFAPYRQLGATSYRYELAPAPAVREQFWQQLVDSADDLFPEVELAGYDTPGNIECMRSFLQHYRQAERVVLRGQIAEEPEVHCGLSTSHLRRLFGAKGIRGHTVVCTRLLSDDQGAMHTLLSKLQRSSRLQGLTLFDAHARLRSTESSWGQLTAGERAVLQQSSIQHAVALLDLGGRYYIADVNAQQFGSAYDALVFCPAAEAVQHGYLLGYVQGAFHEYVRAYHRGLAERHVRIREEMLRQGTLRALSR